jgi:hypothetical protein
MTEKKEERLTELLRRSDALNDACAAVEDWAAAPDAIARTLEVLRPMREEASRDFHVYRRELGLPE